MKCPLLPIAWAESTGPGVQVPVRILCQIPCVTLGETPRLCGSVSPSGKRSRKWWRGEGAPSRRRGSESYPCILSCLPPSFLGGPFFLRRKFTRGSKLDPSTLSSRPTQLTDHWSQDQLWWPWGETHPQFTESLPVRSRPHLPPCTTLLPPSRRLRHPSVWGSTTRGRPPLPKT